MRIFYAGYMPKVVLNWGENVVLRPMRNLSSFLQLNRLLWAAPCSLLGLLMGAAMQLAGGRMRWADGALECCLEQGALAAWLQRHQPFAAITLGHVIIAVHAQDLQRLHAHERVHVKQFERWGALMLLAYPAASVWAWWQGEDPYFANCFEREACLAEAFGKV
jgi:hypothetical protein